MCDPVCGKCLGPKWTDSRWSLAARILGFDARKVRRVVVFVVADRRPEHFLLGNLCGT